MAINKALAKQQGLSEEEIEDIETMHSFIDAYIEKAIETNIPEENVKEFLTFMDFRLQKLWNFPQDAYFHTLYKRFWMKKHWVNKKYRCKITGEEFTIPENVRETDCFFFGEALVDVGRVESYCRFCNVEEIKE